MCVGAQYVSGAFALFWGCSVGLGVVSVGLMLPGSGHVSV